MPRTHLSVGLDLMASSSNCVMHMVVFLILLHRDSVVSQDHMLATAFHPELTQDDRFHRLFLTLVEDYLKKQTTPKA